MSEQLTDIKQRFESMKSLESFKKLAPTELFFDDINYLIQQAEKVEQLQKENTHLNKTIGKYVGKISDVAEELNTLATELIHS